MPRAAALALATSLAVCGCVDRSNVTGEVLGLAVADAGFPCETVMSASELDVDSWRVACDGGRAYVATVLVSGDICVEPLPVGDFSIGLGGARQTDRSGQPAPVDRCAPDVKVR